MTIFSRCADNTAAFVSVPQVEAEAQTLNSELLKSFRTGLDTQELAQTYGLFEYQVVRILDEQRNVERLQRDIT